MTKYDTNWDEPEYRMWFYEKRCEKLEKVLSDILAIIDGDEFRSADILAYVHGYRVSEETSKRNGEIIEEAYRLLGRERPRGCSREIGA